MAWISTGPTTNFNMHHSEHSRLGSGDISCWGGDNMGKCSYFSSGEEYYRHGCDYGWYSTSAGLLFHYALVENSVAKLKYAFLFIFFVHLLCYLCGSRS